MDIVITFPWSQSDYIKRLLGIALNVDLTVYFRKFALFKLIVLLPIILNFQYITFLLLSALLLFKADIVLLLFKERKKV